MTETPTRIDGVLQLPVVRLKGGPKPGTAGPDGWHTGIRCPRCCEREIVYNGNYFCRGLTFDNPSCGWALPHTDEPPHFTEPHHVALQKALTRTQRRRPESREGGYAT